MGFGSFAGSVDPSRDYLAEALTRGAQSIGQGAQQMGQGVAQGAQNYAAGKHQQEVMKAQADQKRLAAYNADLEAVDREAARLQTAPDISPEQLNSFVESRRAEVQKRYGIGTPDNLNKAFTPQTALAPVQKQTEGEPPDNIAAAFNQQPATAPAQVQQPEPAQPMRLTAPQLLADARTRGLERKEQESLSALQEKLQNQGYEGLKNKIPGLSEYNINDPAQARQALGTIQAYNNEQDRLSRSSNVNYGQVKDQQDREDRYRKEFVDLVDPKKEDTPGAVLTLIRSARSLAARGDRPSDTALVKLFVRAYDKGRVTDDEYNQVATLERRSWSSVVDEAKRDALNQSLTEQTRQQIVNALSTREDSAIAQYNAYVDQYEALARNNGLRTEQVLSGGRIKSVPVKGGRIQVQKRGNQWVEIQ